MRRTAGRLVLAATAACLAASPLASSTAAIEGGWRPDGGTTTLAADPNTAIPFDPGGVNELISVDPQGNQFSFGGAIPAISSDGRRVAFVGSASTPGTTSGSTYQLMIRDRDVQTTTPIDLTGVKSYRAFDPSTAVITFATLSGDGQVAALDLASGQQRRIVLWSAGTGASDPFLQVRPLFYSTESPSLSQDGRYLAFIGYTNSLAAVANTSIAGYFVLDRSDNSIRQVGYDEFGKPIVPRVGKIVISADGSTVAIADERNSDLFIDQVWRDQVGSTTGQLISANASGGDGDGSSTWPALSADGSVLAFASDATDLVTNDTNKSSDIFVWTSDGGLTRVSTAPDGTELAASSTYPAISATGRFVAYATTTRAAPPNQDRSSLTDIFVADRQTQRYARMSVSLKGGVANETSYQPVISGTGQTVGFASLASDIVGTDANNAIDVFVRDREPVLRAATNPTDFGSTRAGDATAAVTKTVTVRNSGGWTGAIGPSTLASGGVNGFQVKADGCQGANLEPGTTCAIRLLFVPPTSGAFSDTLVIAGVKPANAPKVALTGRGTAGSLKVSPVMGPPGTVAIVTGTGFAANTQVTLAWSVGITSNLPETVMTDGKGRFSTQMLILPGDIVGPRQLRVTLQLVSGPSAPSTTRFLVTEPTGVPPLFGAQYWRDPFGRVIVLRR